MDSLDALLDGPRAREAFLLRTVMSPPWSVRTLDEAPLTLLAVARGHAWLLPESGEPIFLGPGDVAITRGPAPYTLCDSPSTPPSILVYPGQRCVSLTGEPLHEAMALGLRTWGNDAAGETIVLVGTYESMGDISDRLLRALPPVLSLASDDWDCPVLPWLCDEVARDEPGQSTVVDRMLDLVVIAAVRAWFLRPEADPPAWYRAQSDPIVGRALSVMQNNPAEPWTVASVAAQAGVSRAALARRFQDLVGEPPMTFLTGWRLDLAADLLQQPEATISSVARAVGYSTPFALSAAFKRVRGVSPREHRNRESSRATVGV